METAWFKRRGWFYFPVSWPGAIIVLTALAFCGQVFRAVDRESLPWMGTLHLLFWFISTVFGLRFLKAGFSLSEARSSAGLGTWIIIFVLVMLQMTTALRPIVGKADTFLPTEKKFFVSHWNDCLKSPEQESQNGSQ